MDEQDIRARAEEVCAALVAGNVDRAIETFSEQLRRNPGEVIALFPLPATEAAIESIAHTGSGYTVVLRLVGETDEVQLQTRWKERDGEATLIEVSHLSSTERAQPTGQDGEDEADETGT